MEGNVESPGIWFDGSNTEVTVENRPNKTSNGISYVEHYAYQFVGGTGRHSKPGTLPDSTVCQNFDDTFL